MTEQISQFIAKTKNGITVTLLAFHHYREIEDCSGSYRDLAGKSVTTADGEVVNYLEQGKFEIARTGEILTSTDPACPPYE